MYKCDNCGRENTSKSCLCGNTNEGDFTLSMVTGLATNNAVVGALIGGDIVGALLGDLMNDGGLF